MTWSHIGSVNGSSSVTYTPSGWPAGIQDGDLVVFFQMIAPDSSDREFTCSTAGWSKQSKFGAAARFMWARYSAALALPTLTQGATSATSTWRMHAFRSTKSPRIGEHYGVDGTPPAATAHTTTTDETLMVMAASVPGDTGYSWTATGGFTELYSSNGNGTGNANYPNIWYGWRTVSSPATVSDIRAYLNATRYYLLVAGENVANQMIFGVD